MAAIEIRDASLKDSALILKLIKELAASEHAASEVRATEADIRESLFGPHATACAAICRVGGSDAGFAVYFFNYSTRQGKRGLCLDDLYVSPRFRESGAGEALLKYLAKVAVSKGCTRLVWNTHDWNERTTQLYRSIGAKPLNEWLRYRPRENGLEEFANSE